MLLCVEHESDLNVLTLINYQNDYLSRYFLEKLMKRCLRLFALTTLATSLHGCSLWYFDHDYEAANAKWESKTANQAVVAAR